MSFNEQRGAIIEIVERRKKPAEDSPGASLVSPNEVRINGRQILMPQDEPITVHEVRSDGVVKVTLTLFARRIFIGHEDVDEAVTDAVSAATNALAEAQRKAAAAQVEAATAVVRARDELVKAHRQLSEATSA